jgi:hypothetical protein
MTFSAEPESVPRAAFWPLEFVSCDTPSLSNFPPPQTSLPQHSSFSIIPTPPHKGDMKLEVGSPVLKKMPLCFCSGENFKSMSLMNSMKSICNEDCELLLLKGIA